MARPAFLRLFKKQLPPVPRRDSPLCRVSSWVWFGPPRRGWGPVAKQSPAHLPPRQRLSPPYPPLPSKAAPLVPASSVPSRTSLGGVTPVLQETLVEQKLSSRAQLALWPCSLDSL